jgi:phage-related protein
MPAVRVVFFQRAPGDSPVVEWLRELNRTSPRAFDKCRAAVARLALLGHELRRPEVDYVGDGIHELRVRLGSVNYRLLYFFHGRSVCVVAHGLTKEAAIPAADVDRALSRRHGFTADPAAHTFVGEVGDA